MTPLLFATLAAMLVGAAHALANAENEKGHHWAGLAGGLVALWCVGFAGLSLLGTDLGVAALAVGIPVSIRIAIELGYSISEIIRPDLELAGGL